VLEQTRPRSKMLNFHMSQGRSSMKCWDRDWAQPQQPETRAPVTAATRRHM
jgi:hypothetical protein